MSLFMDNTRLGLFQDKNVTLLGDLVYDFKTKTLSLHNFQCLALSKQVIIKHLLTRLRRRTVLWAFCAAAVSFSSYWLYNNLERLRRGSD